MRQYSNLGDKRRLASCIHCGGSTETRDHNPFKVFLDKPYPTNLPVVLACSMCNSGFSSDGEYVACLLDCVIAGTTEIARLPRKKIRDILSGKPALAARIARGRQQVGSEIAFSIEYDRIRNVVLKLARGHAAFDLNEPRTDEPSELYILPHHLMTPECSRELEARPALIMWPEVGSRAIQRILDGPLDTAGQAP
jgi:hypothetical protein